MTAREMSEAQQECVTAGLSKLCEQMSEAGAAAEGLASPGRGTMRDYLAEMNRTLWEVRWEIGALGSRNAHEESAHDPVRSGPGGEP